MHDARLPNIWWLVFLCLSKKKKKTIGNAKHAYKIVVWTIMNIIYLKQNVKSTNDNLYSIHGCLDIEMISVVWTGSSLTNVQPN